MEKSFETEVLTRLAVIESKLDSQKETEQKVESVGSIADKAYTLATDNKDEIKQIKDNNKWLFRTTVGAIITGLISIGIAFLKGGN